MVNNTINSKIKNLIEEIKEKGVLALAHENEEKQTMITNWAQDILTSMNLFSKATQRKLKVLSSCLLQNKKSKWQLKYC